jgi:hypothetical protein
MWRATTILLGAAIAFCARPGAPAQTGATQNTLQLPPGESKTLAPDLPLSSLPEAAVSVRFVVEHRSALNGHSVRVRGVVNAAVFGDNACPSNRGMCMQPSVILNDPDCRDNQVSCSIRVLVPVDTKPQDYPVGKLLEMRTVARGDKEGVLLTKVN